MLKQILVLNFEAYWNPNRYYSYKDLFTFLILGGRGTGKTTGLAWKVGTNFNKRKEQFVLIRRYKAETKKARDFFSKVWTDYEVEGGDGTYMLYTKDIKGKKELVGYFLTLSKQADYKSGINFDKVTTIIYDEAIIRRKSSKRYLSDEMTDFFELISSITRTRTNYKIFILGNNLDLFNPYFEYFSIPLFKSNYISKERGLYCEYIPTKEELKKLEAKTPLYRLTHDTKYGEYHYDNKLLRKSEGVVEEKSKNAMLLCRFCINKNTLNIYLSNNRLYVEFREKEINDNYSFLIYKDGKPNYYHVKQYRQAGIARLISRLYYNNEVSYSSERAIDYMAGIMEVLQ